MLDEGEQGKDDLVDEDVEVGEKEVGKIKDDNVNDEDGNNMLVVDSNDLDEGEVAVGAEVILDVNVEVNDDVVVIVEAHVILEGDDVNE